MAPAARPAMPHIPPPLGLIAAHRERSLRKFAVVLTALSAAVAVVTAAAAAVAFVII